MNCKLGKKSKKELGLMPDGYDYHSDELIDPDFYGILKEEGLDSARKLDGSYWNKETQMLWENYQDR